MKWGLLRQLSQIESAGSMDPGLRQDDIVGVASSFESRHSASKDARKRAYGSHLSMTAIRFSVARALSRVIPAKAGTHMPWVFDWIACRGDVLAVAPMSNGYGSRFCGDDPNGWRRPGYGVPPVASIIRRILRTAMAMLATPHAISKLRKAQYRTGCVSREMLPAFTGIRRCRIA